MNLLIASTTATDAILIVCAFALLAAFCWGFNRWTNGQRWYREASRRPEPVPPSGFNQAILEHYLLTLNRRDGLAVHAELAREDLDRVEARELGAVA